MPKIQYTGLINTISGKLSGTVLSSRKGTNYLKRHRQNQHQPRNSNQQTVRGNLNTLSGKWYNLSESNKELWNSFASMQKKPMSGLNAHNSLNLAIFKYLDKNQYISSPPPTPGIRYFFSSFNVYSLGSGSFCLTWTSSAITCVTVISQYWAMPGRDDISIKRWSFGNCSTLASGVHAVNTGYPEDTRVKFRIRSMDRYGRFSPWLYSTKFLFYQAGRYGYTSYAWSYYGP